MAWTGIRTGLQLVDLQYSDVRADQGSLPPSRGPRRDADTAADGTRPDGDVEPPDDTRAYFRGQCLQRYGSAVAAASWDSVIFDVGRESLVRVPTLEPLRGTKAHVGELLERCPTAPSLSQALVGPH